MRVSSSAECGVRGAELFPSKTVAPPARPFHDFDLGTITTHPANCLRNSAPRTPHPAREIHARP